MLRWWMKAFELVLAILALGHHLILTRQFVKICIVSHKKGGGACAPNAPPCWPVGHNQLC